MSEKPQRQHEVPHHHNLDDRDEMNALFQRHPSKPGQGSATRADNGVPVSTTEHPVQASSLDPETSGQAASTVTLPGTLETDVEDAQDNRDVRDEGDSSAPPAVATSSSTSSETSSSTSESVPQNTGSPPPSGTTPPPAA